MCFCFQQYDRYVQYNDVRGQLKFLEQLEHVERQRKYEEEREMILQAAKVTECSASIVQRCEVQVCLAAFKMENLKYKFALHIAMKI